MPNLLITAAPWLIVSSAMIYLCLKHWVRPQRVNHPYLGYPFLDSQQTHAHQAGLTWIDPTLWSVRSILLLSLSILIFVETEPLSETQGTLVITNGPLTIDAHWPRPLFVTSASPPFRSLVLDDRGYGEWTQGPPEAIPDLEPINAPLLFAHEDWSEAQKWAEDYIRPEKVIFIKATPEMIRSTQATWHPISKDQLKVEVWFRPPKVIDSVHAEQLAYSQRGILQWIDLGHLEEQTSGRWQALFSENQLQSATLRLTPFFEGKPIRSPVGLCVPRRAPSIQEGSLPLSAMSTLTAEWPKRDDEHMDHRGLGQQNEMLTARQVTATRNEQIAHQINFMGGARSGYTSTLRWAPLSPLLHLNLPSSVEDRLVGSHAIALPPFPSPPLFLRRFNLITQGHPLLWVVPQSRSTDKDILHTWSSDASILNFEVSPEGTQRLLGGFLLSDLDERSQDWLKRLLEWFVAKEAIATSPCIEWPEGHPLSYHLPKLAQAAYLPFEASNHSSSLGYDLNQDLNNAIQEGIITVKLNNKHNQGDKFPLSLVRRPDWDQVSTSPPLSRLEEIEAEPRHIFQISERLTRRDKVTLISLTLLFFSLMAWLLLRRVAWRMNLMIVGGGLFIIGLFRLLSHHQPVELSLSLENAGDEAIKRQLNQAGFKVTPSTFVDSDSPLVVSVEQAPLNKRQRHQLARYSGPIWLLPKITPLKPLEFHSPLLLRDDQDSLHMRTLIFSDIPRAATIYLAGLNKRLELKQGWQLLGARISDEPHLTALELRVEIDREEAPPFQLSRLIPTPNFTPRDAMAWGKRGADPLKNSSYRTLTADPEFLDQPLSQSLALISLHRVSLRDLTEAQSSHLDEWVRSGGTLLLTGEIGEKTRSQDRSLWAGERWSRLLPLTLDPPVNPSRQTQVVFFVDRSGSMAREAGGAGLDEITAHLTSLVSALAPRDEVTLISFGGGVHLTSPPTERRSLTHLPVPEASRGGTLLHPALELALTYRRPSLPATWVVVTDGVWGDDHDRLLGDLTERLNASGANITVALTEDNLARCEELCEQWIKATGARLTRFSDLGSTHLRSPRIKPLYGELKPQATRHWDQRVGGALPMIKSLSPLGAHTASQVLAEVEGYPLLAARNVDAGQVIALASDFWSLTPQQWNRLLSSSSQQRSDWQILMRDFRSDTLQRATQVEARSHTGILNSSATLISHHLETPEQVWWIPQRSGRSILSRCPDRSTLQARIELNREDACEPVLLSPQKTPITTIISDHINPRGPSARLALSLSSHTYESSSQHAQATQESIKRERALQLPPLHISRDTESLISSLADWTSKHRHLFFTDFFKALLILIASVILIDLFRWRPISPQLNKNT